MNTPKRRWRPRRPWVPPLIGIIAVLLSLVGPFPPQPVLAAYQATADSNVSAFNPPCLGWNDPHPARMLTLAVNGMAALGYSVSGYKGAAFTRAHTLARTVDDWSYYVRCTGWPYSCVKWGSVGPPDSSADSSSDHRQRPIAASMTSAARCIAASVLDT